MKILLMGNPNVGKSALFSRITGLNVICSNYPGTTVSYCEGNLIYDGKQSKIIDVPGTYSLENNSPVEKVATDMVEKGDLIINVIDATNLERNLYLTLELIETGKPIITTLNMWDDTHHLGVSIDIQKLEELLEIPVTKTVAITGEGVKRMIERIPDAKKQKTKKLTESEKWEKIGKIVSEVQQLKHRHHTLIERIEDASVNPITGIPIAILILYLTFNIIIKLGNQIIEKILDPFFYNIYGPFIRGLVNSVIPSGIIHEILIGTGDDFIESLGVLTTGVYVPLDMVLPFVILFYFMLSLLEDSGYLPRLATLMDTLMHRIGLHGSAIVPTILGLGCNVPGMLSTRILESKKQRFIAATLLSICIPCIAQNAIIMGLLLNYGLKYLAIVYATLFILFVVIGFTLNKIIPGETPEIILEIPPYRLPSIKSSLKKTYLRVRHFLTSAVPYMLAGVLIINLTYVLGFIDVLTKIFGPVMSKLFGLPETAILALIVGFIRKDVAVGMLAPLAMTPMQLTVASTILAIYFPCIATYTLLIKELGVKDSIKSTGIMLLVTIVVGVLMKTILL